MMPMQAEPKRAAASRPTRRASMAFMEMLRGARDPSVSAQSTWPEVAPQFAGDRRFEAVAEEQRRQMFDTFLEALAKVEEARAQRQAERAATDFKVSKDVQCCVRRPPPTLTLLPKCDDGVSRPQLASKF